MGRLTRQHVLDPAAQWALSDHCRYAHWHHKGARCTGNGGSTTPVVPPVRCRCRPSSRLTPRRRSSVACWGNAVAHASARAISSLLHADLWPNLNVGQRMAASHSVEPSTHIANGSFGAIAPEAMARPERPQWVELDAPGRLASPSSGTRPRHRPLISTFPSSANWSRRSFRSAMLSKRVLWR